MVHVSLMTQRKLVSLILMGSCTVLVYGFIWMRLFTACEFGSEPSSVGTMIRQWTSNTPPYLYNNTTSVPTVPLPIDCMQRKPLHVYMLPQLQVKQLMAMAFGWKLRMLFGICRPIVLHFEPFHRAGDNSLLISRFAVPPRPVKAKRNLGLFQMSDEPGATDLDRYRQGGGDAKHPRPAYDYVIRDYYRPKYQPAIDQGWLLWMPTGPRYGVEPTASSSLVGLRHRRFRCSFLGTIPADRGAQRGWARIHMRDALRRMGNPCFVEAKPSGFGGRRDALDYSAVLRDSQFTLCPWDNHQETIRLWDALETGSIPVMLNATEFLHLLPMKLDNQTGTPHQPVVTLATWDQLADLLRDRTRRPQVYERWQKQNILWWKRFKTKLTRNLDDLITQSYHNNNNE